MTIKDLRPSDRQDEAREARSQHHLNLENILLEMRKDEREFDFDNVTVERGHFGYRIYVPLVGARLTCLAINSALTGR